MSYSMQKLTEELQKAVAMRGTNQQAPASKTDLPKARFEISPEVADFSARCALTANNRARSALVVTDRGLARPFSS